jgi:hypothetical protein
MYTSGVVPPVPRVLQQKNNKNLLYTNFFQTLASGLALGPTQSPILWVARTLSLWVKLLGREAVHLPPLSAEVKNA